ncbi:MAG: adenine-specific methyltransferase EcoRI family protein [Synergistaceae bacterium]|nr:adenine-specific methyltransferase EcoRI family protein [Synergistaceae bacterium]
MARNKALQDAARARQDEFYTDLRDIEHELMYYMPLFKGKTVLCNCDDPYESAFFEYFATSFNILGLRKLIATCYAGSPIAQQQLSLFEEDTPAPKRKPYCAQITSLEDFNGDGRKDYLDVEYILQHNVGGSCKVLEGDGDFRSPECLELLREADVVVTNPPHSLLREYIALLIEYGKEFVILGNINAVTYKEVFPLIMKNQMWLGVSIHSGDRKFYVPEYYPLEAAGCGNDDEGRRFIRVKGVRWFTNMDHHRHNETLCLFRKYHDDPSKYPHYDNYDAIEVSKVVDIPCDWLGVMGVPVTFLDKYNPKQFEILGMSGTNFSEGVPACHVQGTSRNAKISGKDIYRRIFIRRIGGIM